MNTQDETVTVSASTWRWAQEAALMLAAPNMCGADRLPIWNEAQRMCDDQPPLQSTGLTVVHQGGVYGR